MLMIVAALSAQTLSRGREVFGRYLRTNLTTTPRCDQPNEHYLTISPSGIGWEDGKFDPIISLNSAGENRFYIWIKDSKSGKAVLIGVYIYRKYDNAIVISDEQAAAQAQIDQPGHADIGVAVYARCPA